MENVASIGVDHSYVENIQNLNELGQPPCQGVAIHFNQKQNYDLVICIVKSFGK